MKKRNFPVTLGSHHAVKPSPDGSTDSEKSGCAGFRPVLASVAIFAIDAAFWYWMWRNPIISKDDLFFSLRSRDSQGVFHFEKYLSNITVDLGTRNGRIADLFGELFFQVPGALPLIMTFLCVAFSLAVTGLVSQWRLLGGLSDSPWSLTVASAFSVVLPFLIEFFSPGTAGSTYLFMSATVGYLGGATLLLLLLAVWKKLIDSGTFSWWHLAWFVSLSVLVALFHEGIAIVALGTATFLPFIVKDRSRRFWLLEIAVGVPSFLRFFAPGMWARNALINTSEFWSSLSPIKRLEVRTATSFATILDVTALLLWIFSLSLVLVLVLWGTRLRSGLRIIYAFAGLINVASFGFLVGMGAEQLRVLKTVEGDITSLDSSNLKLYLDQTRVVFLLLALLAVSLVAMLAMARSVVKNRAMLLAILLVFIAWLIPAAAGAGNNRPMFFVYVLALVALFGIVAEILSLFTSQKARLAVGTLVGLLCLGAGGVALISTAQANSENISAWEELQQEIQNVKDGEKEVIHIPADLPRPDFASNFQGDVIDYQQKLAVYSGLDKFTPYEVY